MTNDQFWRGALGAIIVATFPYLRDMSRSIRERWNRSRARHRAAATKQRRH